MASEFEYNEQNSLIAKILNLYYNENYNQAQIATKLGLSTVKVNRLLKYARQKKMVEITIRLPFPNLVELETKLSEISNIQDLIVTPSLDNNPEGTLAILAQAAANHLVNQLRTSDRICISGGVTLSKIVDELKPERINGIRIYPAVGGVQRNPNMDINGIATQMSQKLGGESIQFFAPNFAETEGERNTYMGLSHIMKTMEEAKSARIALFGIGALQIDSSFLQYCPIPYRRLAELVEQAKGVGEILGSVCNQDGCACIPELDNLRIGISLHDLLDIPIRIGAACGAIKAPAIAAAIKGNYLTSLIIDENAAKQALNILEIN
jgi:DNA-binding transcriptional regulator LsrR (DeoR family)